MRFVQSQQVNPVVVQPLTTLTGVSRTARMNGLVLKDTSVM